MKLNRRTFLAGVGMAALPLTSGCIGILEKPIEKSIRVVDNIETAEPVVADSRLDLAGPYPWWDKHLFTTEADVETIRWDWLEQTGEQDIHPLLERIDMSSQFFSIVSILLPPSDQIYPKSHRLRDGVLRGNYEVQKFREERFYAEAGPVHHLVVIYDREGISIPENYEAEIRIGSDIYH